MTALESARAKLMDAQQEYLADRIEVHGDNAATRAEAFDRIAQLTKAAHAIVRACHDNGVDDLSDDRAAVMVGLMMDDTPDEKYMIGWMCEVAAMEGE